MAISIILTILVVVGVIGGMTVFVEWLDARYRRKVSNFVETEGIVVSSSSIYDPDPERPDYKTSIEFSFEVAGEKHLGHQRWLDNEKSEYPPDSKVTVYYNPLDTSEAIVVLTMGTPVTRLPYILGFMAIGGLLIWLIWS